jgi:Pentapeptide repeats (9 copies)
MAGLADDWEKKENRQTCVDVLCAYLRLPYDPAPGDEFTTRPVATVGLEDALAKWAAYHANREVRHTIIRLIGAHLRPGAPVSWQGLNFDFSGVVFDGADFSSAQFSSGTVDFSRAQFSDGDVDFHEAQFSGSKVDFNGAQFSGGMVHFTGAQFSGGTLHFYGARFSRGAKVVFYGAQFSRAEVVDFRTAEFSGGKLDFTDADWSFPPTFSWEGTPPSGVKLPQKEGQSPS